MLAVGQGLDVDQPRGGAAGEDRRLAVVVLGPAGLEQDDADPAGVLVALEEVLDQALVARLGDLDPQLGAREVHHVREREEGKPCRRRIAAHGTILYLLPMWKHPLLLPLFLALSLPLAADPVATGDAAWARRAEGRQGARALPGPVDQAIAAYESAVRERPDRLEASWKLLRALHFKGDYTGCDREQQQEVFGRGREVFEAAVDQIGRKVGGRKKLDALSPPEAAKAVAGIPEARHVFLWGAIHYGLWGDAYGRLAAARQGVGDKVRRNGEIALAIDERFDSAGPHRLLGRLHALAPKVPLVTGWVDRAEAVSHLRRAVALAPEEPQSQLYLAEALLEHQPEKAAEAREILRRLVQIRPRPERVVEDESALADARELLGKR